MLRDRGIHFHPLFTFEKMRHFARRERSREAHTYPPVEAERLDHLAHAAQRAVINGWRTGLGPRELREGPEHNRDRRSRGVCFPDSTPLIRSPFLTTLRAVPSSSISPSPTETSPTDPPYQTRGRVRSASRAYPRIPSSNPCMGERRECILQLDFSCHGWISFPRTLRSGPGGSCVSVRP